MMAFSPWPKDFPTSIGGLQDEVNRLMEKLWHAGISTGPFDGQDWAPRLDLLESEQAYVLYLEMPGVAATQLDLSYLDGALTVRGAKPPIDAETQGLRRLRSERQFGAFNRTVNLPCDIDEGKIEATCNNGVIEITMPKSESSKPRTIKVNVGG
jgi:HSP20 family protein